MASPRASPMLRDRRRGSRSAVLLLALVVVSCAMALDIDDVHITKHGRAYQVQMTFDVAAPVNRVMATLTDYGFPDRLNPEVTNREVISRQSGITRVRTEMRSCVFFFCKDIALTQDVTVIADTIQADIVPDESDFRSGYFRWSVSSSDNGGSHISFEAVIEPDFFIPPLVGGFFFRKSLRQEILATARNLEIEAAREPAPVMHRNR
ncbi:MAG: SRPBCC family protein [Proteobacteria bacterium]|nr:SRPBCC family protein [Pseudomonadota bacterium]